MDLCVSSYLLLMTVNHQTYSSWIHQFCFFFWIHITKRIDLNNRRKGEKTESTLHPLASFLLHNFFTFILLIIYVAVFFNSHFLLLKNLKFFAFYASNQLMQFHWANVYLLSQMRKPTIFSSNPSYYFQLFFAIVTFYLRYELMCVGWKGHRHEKYGGQNLFKSIIVGNCIFMPNTIAISNSQYEATVPCPHILATICERNFMGRVPLWQKYKKKE